VFRRSFLGSLLAGLFGIFAGGLSRDSEAIGTYSFDHGVASGDPLHDAIILWTRISGGTGEGLTVKWQIARDPDMQDVLRHGSVRTNQRRDYTIKADARNLPAGTSLYYQFDVGGTLSEVGRTRTLPAGVVDQGRLAVVSCSNYAAGYFHAYREIAKRDDIDVVVHLGDFIYEYGVGGYATEHAESMNRVPVPETELLSLTDYRQRYAQYKSDPDARAMHAAHPLIAVWDDHEIANDSWRDGALNHGDDEGRWSRRCDAAVQAYFEWMPIRGEAKGKETRIFREFRFGDLASLIMLDTRLFGRDRQPDIGDNVTQESVREALGDPKRRMLGYEQEKWLRNQLRKSGDATWQLIGQQVMVSKLRSPDLEPLIDPEGPTQIGRERLQQTIAMSVNNPTLLLDTWDGYPVAREDLLGDLKELAVNPVILSGDLHTSIAGNLIRAGQEEPVAVEFMAGSVSSPGFAEYLPEYRPGSLSAAALTLNPGLQYMETERRGWLCLTISKAECIGEWHLLDSVQTRSYKSQLDRRLTVKAGQVSKGLRDA
jgi:alkaline phosphatase D